MSCHIDAVVRKYQNIPTTTYETKNILTDSFALNDDWQHFIAPKDLDGEVVDIAQIPFEKRSHDQKTHMVQWLCEKWPTARQMGIVKCMAMTKVLKHFSYKAGENIVTEGDTGLTFYIIIDGETEVHKGGVGVVARLGAGFSFGEIALSGKDTRTATVRAAAHNQVEVLSLHKLDYDRFVKDIQQAERREQFNFYRGLPMFSEWSRDRLERLGNSSFRKEVADGDTIFRQNDESDFFYFVYEGSVEVIKEIDIIMRNRWPIGANGWDTLVNRTKETHTLHTCTRGHPFGEHSVLMSDNKPKPFISHDKDDSVTPPLRPYTAIARGRTVVFVVSRLEMLHVLVGLPSTEYDKVVQPARIEWDDLAILKNIPSVVGGPSSTAQAGDRLIYPNTVKVSTKVTPTPNPSQLNYSEQSAMLVAPQNHKGVHKQKFMTKAMREKEARSKSAFVLKRHPEDMGHSSHMKESNFNTFQEQMSEALRIAVAIKEKEKEFQERLIVTDLEVPEKRERMGLLGLCEWDEEGTSPASRIKTKMKSQSQSAFEATKDGQDPRQPRPKSAYAQPSLRADRASLRSGSNTLASASKRMSSRSNAAKQQLSHTFASGQCLGDILGGTGLPRRRPSTQSDFQRGAVEERDCPVVNVDAPQGPFADAHATAQDDAHARGCSLTDTRAHLFITTGTGTDGDWAGGSTAPLAIDVADFPDSDARVRATSDSAAVSVNQSHTGPTARISRAGRRPATASATSSRSDASRSITFSPMQRNLRHYPKMFQGNGGRNRTPLAGEKAFCLA
jgi:CRP-like cAMP-binding protein